MQGYEIIILNFIQVKNYQLKPDVLNDKGQVLYAEHYSNNNKDVLYTKYEYNSYGNRTYYERGFVKEIPNFFVINKCTYWIKYEYNDNEELIYWIDSDNEWSEWEYDGYKLVYYATSEGGVIQDDRKIDEHKLANDLYDYSAE